MKSSDLGRRPDEEWGEYVTRLERKRLKAIGDYKHKEGDALYSVGEAKDDEELRIAGKAKHAAADEFYKAIEAMKRGAKSRDEHDAD